jgi:hypothetical protein
VLSYPQTTGRKRFESLKKALGIMLAHPFATRKEGIMKYKQILTGSVGRKEAICIALLGLGFSGCATVVSDANYADRNNIDSRVHAASS